MVSPVTAPVGSRLAIIVSMYAGELNGAAAHQHGHEVAHHLTHRLGQPKREIVPGQRPRLPRLHPELDRAADDRAPRQRDRELIEIPPPAEQQQRPDHRGVPADRRNIREQEPAVAVQDARHQAEATRMPAPGNRIRTSRTASSRLSPVNPGATSSTSSGAASTPSRTSRACRRQDREEGPRHLRRRLVLTARPQRGCTGMNDPDSAPSPNRFCSRLGMRNAALNASTAMLFCPNSRAISRTRNSPAKRLTRIPAPTAVSGRATRFRTALGLEHHGKEGGGAASQASMLLRCALATGDPAAIPA